MKMYESSRVSLKEAPNSHLYSDFNEAMDSLSSALEALEAYRDGDNRKDSSSVNKIKMIIKEINDIIPDLKD